MQAAGFNRSNFTRPFSAIGRSVGNHRVAWILGAVGLVGMIKAIQYRKNPILSQRQEQALQKMTNFEKSLLDSATVKINSFQRRIKDKPFLVSQRNINFCLKTYASYDYGIIAELINLAKKYPALSIVDDQGKNITKIEFYKKKCKAYEVRDDSSFFDKAFSLFVRFINKF